jgi:hypothetical protein
MFSVRMIRLSCCVVGGLLLLNVEAQAGEIQIRMYSLPSAGVRLRTGTPIRVRAFGVQASTDATPLRIGTNELDLTPAGADAAGNVSTGIAVFTVPDSFFVDPGLGDNIPISFQFEIGNTTVQTVLAAVVPRRGSVTLDVVVPNPTRSRCEPADHFSYCIRSGHVRRSWRRR